MKLTYYHRIIILSTLLIQHGTLKDIKTSRSIRAKIDFTPEEQECLKIKKQNGNVFVNESDLPESVEEFDLTPDEIVFLKTRINFLDKNSSIQEGAIDT